MRKANFVPPSEGAIGGSGKMAVHDKRRGIRDWFGTNPAGEGCAKIAADSRAGRPPLSLVITAAVLDITPCQTGPHDHVGNSVSAPGHDIEQVAGIPAPLIISASSVSGRQAFSVEKIVRQLTATYRWTIAGIICGGPLGESGTR